MPASAPDSGWRSWHGRCPCPVCGGWPRAGRSGQQCCGGFFVDRPRVAFCSGTRSPAASRSGKTWRHELTAPVAWVEDATHRVASDRPIRLSTPRRLPYDLEKHSQFAWREAGRWHYMAPAEIVDDVPNRHVLSPYELAFAESVPHTEPLYAFTVVRYDALDARTAELVPGEKTYRTAIAEQPENASSPFIAFRVLPERLIPYRAPELLAGIRAGLDVVLVEGEKSADCIALRFPGRYAVTTAAGGALRFDKTPHWEHWLRGTRRAHLIVDRDENGKRWARTVLDTLRKLESVPTVWDPEPMRLHVSCWQSATTGVGDDVVDHLGAGFRLDQLVRMNAEELWK
jgi:hypothetical protein